MCSRLRDYQWDGVAPGRLYGQDLECRWGETSQTPLEGARRRGCLGSLAACDDRWVVGGRGNAAGRCANWPSCGAGSQVADHALAEARDAAKQVDDAGEDI